MPQLGPADALLAVLIAIAVYTDVRTGKIKNWLTFPMMLAGCALAPLLGAPWWFGLLGVVVALVVCLPFYALGRALYPGDVKMLMAAGALMGAEAAARATLFSVALILPVGIVVLTVKRRWSNVPKVLRGEAPATTLFHAPVVGVAILLARLQPWPELW